ncbi:uncharacterized protein LOC131472801 [Solea solea]|uniref:uncharacterized protein LOC131472801 n=1 Tax=Solea solea TaxID=90069 RepID=UPI00272D2E2F|nr:uncharacterized protein LOC131472801 [Solea solea]
MTSIKCRLQCVNRKMQIIFYFLLLLIVKYHTLGLNFETKTAAVGEDVTLKCDRQSESQVSKLFWIRLISGNMPEVLGGTHSFDFDEVIQNPHFTLKQEPGVFLLHINETAFNDTGVYYCLSVAKPFTMKFLKGTFLSIKDYDITAVDQVPPSNPVNPGDPVTLQCSVLSDSTESQTCPEYHRVHWFRADSDGSNPRLISTHGDGSHKCEIGTEALSPPKCVYNFCENVNSSDAGIYYCAVSTCAQILFGRGTKVDDEVSAPRASPTLLLLCATLTLSLIVNAFLISFIKMKSCDCRKETVAVGRNQQTQQRDENSLVYSAPTFTRRNAGKAERGNGNAAEEETVYSKVRASPRQ